jgi:hypothetical protein
MQITLSSPSYWTLAARTRQASLCLQAREKHLTYDPHATAERANFFARMHESGGAVNDEWRLLHKKLLNLMDATSHQKLRLNYWMLMVLASCLTAQGYAR